MTEEERLKEEVDRLKREKAELQAELDKKLASKREKHFPIRAITAWVLIVLACLMAIVSPIAVWARANFLDTEKFVKTVGPIIEDETVAKALSKEVADRLFEALDIQERVMEALQEALPDKLDFIAGPISTGLQTLTEKITYEVITSSQFQTVWNAILKAAHSNVVGIIRDEKAVSVSTEGEVVLDITELANNVQDRLVEAGLTFLEKIPLPNNSKTIVLFQADQLGMAKQSVKLLDTLNWFLPLLALLLFAAAVFASEDRRKYLMISGVALAVAMALSLTILNVAKGELLGQVKNPANLDAATIIWNQVSSGLVKADFGLLLLGIIGAFGFAIMGPYTWAVWLRHRTADLSEMQRDYRLEGKESGPVGIFFATHIWGIRVFGAAVLFGVLWLLRPLTGVRVLVVLGIYLIYLVVCELLRGKLPETPEEAAGTAEVEKKLEEAEERLEEAEDKLEEAEAGKEGAAEEEKPEAAGGERPDGKEKG